MFDIRLRLMGDDGTTKRAVLPTIDLDTTQVDSATPTLRFVVSEKIAGRLDAPLVVAAEYSTGGPFVQPRNGLFMASVDDSDDADPAGTVRFSGTGFVPWMLARTYLHWSASAKNGERQWIQFPSGSTGSATPGHTLNGMLTESKARGWGPMMAWDFTALKDSAGANWSTAGGDLWWNPWRLLTPLTRVLDQMSSQGYMDWWSEGTMLRMFRPGTGVVRENLVLGGPKFSARPVKSSFDDVFTHLTVVPEKARNWLYLANTGADTRFGRLEATMTQSGVERTDAATAAAQPTLKGGRAVKREYSFDWTPVAGGPVPFADFNVGDVVVSKTRHGKAPQRVIGLQVSKNGDTVTARAIVGDKLLSQAAKQMARTSSASIGGTIGGNGTALPGSQGPTYAGPAAPTALHVESNTASWRPDGTAQATVVLAWDAVSVATDGSGIDIREYEVAERVASGESAVFATTSNLNVTETQWAPGVARFVKVRAVAFNGDVSEWSGEISVTPATPSSIVPKAPTGLAVASNVGAFQADGSALAAITVTWNAVTQSIDNVPVDVAAYEVIVGQAKQQVTVPSATFTVPSGKGVAATVRALTTLDVWGDYSTLLNLTGALPSHTVTPLPAPTLTTGAGGVFIEWDGVIPGSPAGVQGVFAEYRVGTTGTFLPVAGPLAVNAGQVGQVRPAVGSVVQVRLRWKDTLGRVSNAGTTAQITVTGIEIPDFDPTIDIAELIQANSIVADMVQMDVGFADKFFANEANIGRINVDMLAPNVGDTLNLSANGAVTTIINQQQDQASQIASTQSGVDQAAQAAQDAADAAAGAQAGVDATQGQVSSLADEQAATAGQVTTIQTWFRVDADGGHMGRSDSPFQSHIKPDRFEITQDGVARAWLEANRLVAPEFVGETVVLSNHKLEKFGTGTVVRRLG